ncbi:MAG: hypothetical protein ACI8W7_004748, partial [Gammaproteobacteria bacterium]
WAGGRGAHVSGTFATDRQGRRECRTIVGNNCDRPTSNAASEAGIVADNSRHSRHPWRSMQRRANGKFILTGVLKTQGLQRGVNP